MYSTHILHVQDTVADLKDFDDLLEQDTGKLGLYQTALDVYETSGIEVELTNWLYFIFVGLVR